VSSAALVCDTSGLIALADGADPDHLGAAEAVRRHTGPLVVSPLVLAETDHLLRSRLGADGARGLADDVAAGAYLLAPLTTAHLADCLDLDRSYADLGLSLTDAHLVVLAREFATTSLLSLDERHLRAVRPLRAGPAFSLLPADS
jgi:predicted nucleic acid-binding protein